MLCRSHITTERWQLSLNPFAIHLPYSFMTARLSARSFGEFSPIAIGRFSPCLPAPLSARTRFVGPKSKSPSNYERSTETRSTSCASISTRTRKKSRVRHRQTHSSAQGVGPVASRVDIHSGLRRNRNPPVRKLRSKARANRSPRSDHRNGLIKQTQSVQTPLLTPTIPLESVENKTHGCIGTGIDQLAIARQSTRI